MKRTKILRFIILCKRGMLNLLDGQSSTLLDNERAIMELIFKDLTTKESVKLYNEVTIKVLKELKEREVKSKLETKLLSTFLETATKNEIK